MWHAGKDLANQYFNKAFKFVMHTILVSYKQVVIKEEALTRNGYIATNFDNGQRS